MKKGRFLKVATAGSMGSRVFRCRITLSFLLPVLLSIFFLFSPALFAASSPNILLLNSYHPGYRWSDQIITGISDTIERDIPNATMFVEYMDSKRLETQESSKQLADLLKEKYRNTALDVIIVADNNALQFLKTNRNTLFPAIPAILCGANDLQPSDIDGVGPISGINEEADSKETIELIFTLLPKTKHIVVVNDTTVTGRNVSREIKRDAESFADRVHFSYWDEMGMEELLGKLGNLSGDTVVLFSFFFRDNKGIFFEYDDSAKRITEASRVPVFGLWEFNLGYGIVGGKLVSGYEQGRIAGEMALRVLQGEDISKIPLQLQSPNRYAFDFRELKKFSIDMSLLPQGSTVLHKEISVYEKYKAIIWGFLLAFIALSVLTIFLLISIGKQRRIEKKLRHSEQRMIEIIDFFPDPTFVIDAEGKILAWNRAIEELTGRPENDMLGKGNYEYALPFYGERRPVMIDLVTTWDDDISKRYRDIEKVGERLVSESSEPNERLDNRHFRNVAGPLYDQDGNFTGAIETLHDITHRRKAEQDAQALYNETQKNLAFIQAMLSAIPAPVYFKDTELRFLGCNQAYSNMQGLAEEEIIGKTVYDIYPKEKADFYFAKDQALLKKPGRQEYETEVQNRNGEVREVFFAKDTFYDHDGKVAGIVGSFMDISELKNAEKEKKQLEAQLLQSQKLEALGTLAGGVAHDFNNILSSVLGYSELGMQEFDASHPALLKFKAINQAGKRAKELVEQILAFSRMQEQLEGPVKVASLMQEVAGLLKSSLPADIELQVQCNSQKSVLGDPTQLHQIIMNLCTNGYHAMLDKGGLLNMSLEEVAIDNSEQFQHVDLPNGDYLCLEVSDTGVGINPTICSRIFDPYFTTKEKDKGTGLGLAVVHGIVKRHKGDIVVESKVNRGTQFYVYLPISGESLEEQTLRDAVLPRGTECVLLIDDEKDLIEIGMAMLQSLGYNVIGIVGSNNGLNAFKEDPEKYDVVISDYNMPGMKGDRLAHELLAIRPDVPIIICTGFSERLNADMMRDAGVQKILLKPMALADMSNGIREVLHQA